MNRKGLATDACRLSTTTGRKCRPAFVPIGASITGSYDVLAFFARRQGHFKYDPPLTQHSKKSQSVQTMVNDLMSGTC